MHADPVPFCGHVCTGVVDVGGGLVPKQRRVQRRCLELERLQSIQFAHSLFVLASKQGNVLCTSGETQFTASLFLQL